LLIEFGTEINGNWFPWNEQYTDAESTNSIFVGQINAMSNWYENFNNTNLRIDTSDQALLAYQNAVSDFQFISKAQFSSENIIYRNGFE